MSLFFVIHADNETTHLSHSKLTIAGPRSYNQFETIKFLTTRSILFIEDIFAKTYTAFVYLNAAAQMNTVPSCRAGLWAL